MARLKRRADGRYTATFMHDGRKQFFYGRTQAEAKTKADTAKARLKRGEPIRDATQTLEAWLDEWVVTYLPLSNRAESTKAMHEGYVRTWIIPVLGKVQLKDLVVSDVNRLLLALKEANKAESTRRNCYTTLRKALDDAVINGLLAVNPAHKVKQPRVVRQEARFLTAAEVHGLLSASSKLRYAVILRFILGTGVRRGEALALEWQDIDLDNGRARLRGSLVRREGRLVVSGLKTKSSRRTVALSPAMVALLRQQKASQASERLLAGSQWRDEGFVFTTALGSPVDPDNLWRSVKAAASRVGLESVTVHTLRHTYATAALLAGAPLKVVSENLGHASISITANTYMHVTDEAALAANEAVAQTLGL